MTRIVIAPSRTRLRPVRAAGFLMFALGVIGFIVGLFVVQSLTSDLRATLSVSRSAMQTIGDTVDIAAELGDGTTEALSSASLAASSAADATRSGATGLDDVAAFLEDELPDDIEAISRALPGVVGAADAIDSTLGALSLVGLDYSPQEPFGESMRRIEEALAGLPAEVRAQSASLSALSPAAGGVASDLDDLSVELADLTVTLGEVDSLSEAYAATVVEAEVAVAGMEDSVDRTVLYLRILLFVGAIGAVIVGYALLSMHRWLTDDSTVKVVDEPVTGVPEEDVAPARRI